MMMIQTKELELDINLLEAAFYEKDYKFSYTSFNKLIESPTVFYKEYVLGQKEEQYGKHLLEGLLIHFLVLEHQGFDDKFCVLGDSLPSETQLQVADYIYTLMQERGENLTLADYMDEIDDYLKEIDKYQSVKDQTKRLAKIIEPKTIEYFEFLKNSQNKIIIDSKLLDRATRRAEVVKTNPQIRELLGMDLVSDGKTYGVYNELELSCDAEEEIPFGFKGVVDNMVVDVKNKLVRINDFKTTGKKLQDFEESVEYWNYWVQAFMYIKLVHNYLKKVLTDEWTVEFRFVVFDKYDHLYAFEVTQETLEKWAIDFANLVIAAKYHYESRDFSLPYDYAQGNVKL